MATTTSKEVSDLIATLQVIEQALTGPTGPGSVSEQTVADLKTGIANLQKLAETTAITFTCINKRFISRQEGVQLVANFDNWSSDIFQSGPFVKMTPLYVRASDVGILVDRATGTVVDRTADKEGYLELLLGKEENKLSILFAAVDIKGNRLFDSLKSEGVRNDLLDYAGPCPKPDCPGPL